MHVEETSLRVDRKNHWIYVCSAGEISLKSVHPKRGRLAKFDAHNHWEQLKDHETAVLLFARGDRVSGRR